MSKGVKLTLESVPIKLARRPFSLVDKCVLKALDPNLDIFDFSFSILIPLSASQLHLSEPNTNPDEY